MFHIHLLTFHRRQQCKTCRISMLETIGYFSENLLLHLINIFFFALEDCNFQCLLLIITVEMEFCGELQCRNKIKTQTNSELIRSHRFRGFSRWKNLLYQPQCLIEWWLRSELSDTRLLFHHSSFTQYNHKGTDSFACYLIDGVIILYDKLQILYGEFINIANNSLNVVQVNTKFI